MVLLIVFADISQGGRLEEALEQYTRSKEYGVERAAMHIRNVRLSTSEVPKF